MDTSAPPAKLEFPAIVLGPPTNLSAIVRTSASTLTSGFVVKHIYLENILNDGDPTDFRADLVVEFNDRIRSIKKMSFPVLFRASLATQKITMCRSVGGIPSLVALNKDTAQTYPAGACPGGLILEPSLDVMRADGNTNNMWVGGGGHGWNYYIKGLSKRYFLDPATFNPNVDHTIEQKFYIGDRGPGPNFGQTAAAFLSFQEITSNAFIRYVDTKLMIQCLK